MCTFKLFTTWSKDFSHTWLHAWWDGFGGIKVPGCVPIWEAEEENRSQM